jgi:hypothetical protein
MSSLLRRIEKRLLKAAGFKRNKWTLKFIGGQPKIVPVKRGGEITDNNDNPVGTRWPRITREFMPEAKPRKPKAKAPRGSRRGITTKKHAAKLAAAKGTAS